jgi:AraC-like DNA-binding protein
VLQVREIAFDAASGILERILGENVQVTSREQDQINNFICGERLRIQPAGEVFTEEQGHLLLFPINDQQFNMHIVYVLPDIASAHIDVYWLQFQPQFFNQYPVEALMSNSPFRFDQTTEQQFSICAQSRLLLTNLRQDTALTPLIKALHQSETALHLLRRAIENVTLPFTVCAVPACRFLVYESEREKIWEAQRIMEQTTEQPLTIKELSRKVAMNECYLKKGFKTLTGKTINEYQQELRITKAKKLLQQHGQTVSEVASQLGYSSISHFSTAFKKATGIKPCELLG